MTRASGDVIAVHDRTTARLFADTHIRPFADEWDRSGQVPATLLDAVSAAGLWDPFPPAPAQGADLTFGTLAEIHEEIGRACSSVRSLLTVHTMVTFAVRRWGTAEQKERWLPELAAGRVTGAFCLTEPEVGSDATAVTTTALRKGGGWVLNGTKTWITGGQLASLFLVFARGPGGVVALLVERGAPGVEITPIDGMLGTTAGMLATVELREAHVGPDALLGPEAFATGMVLTGVLDLGRLSVAAGSVGILQACLDACTARTARREVGGVPLRERQLIRAKISDMVTDVTAARLLCAEAARLKDAGEAETIMTTMMAKYFASTAAARHASEAVQIHGASGCAPGSPVARYYRDAKVMEIIEGSSEIQRLTIADAAYRTAMNP
ncbi:acyl-CoA dehydrogenase family protein [Streptomyces sp. NBC_01716]|uniref:acyl-CoA dehydrogenase family protein n=1 Tax=Streptomyces sp. NBC_01716 TaxID=2975917 RepID=UPI002E369335|nr:acyl-CoA dehydrogenase family protein [Streptomyces sp. NBC_01716]